MQTSFFCFLLQKDIVDKSVGYFFGGTLLMLLFCENIHLSMLFDLSKYTEFGEHKNGE